jgi:hypothetical protein
MDDPDDEPRVHDEVTSAVRAALVAAGVIDDAPSKSSATTGADLPSVPIAKRSIVLAFAVAFVIYVALVPRFVRYANPPTGDQPYYLMDALSILQDGDLNLRNNFEQRDEDKFYARAPHPDGFVGMAAPYPLPPLRANSVARPENEEYHYHPPGLGALLVPAWTVGSWFSLWWPATIVFMCLIGALTALNAFLLAHAITGRLGIAWAVWLPIAFSNPLMSFSFLIFTELPTALLLIYPFRRLALGWRTNGRGRLLLIGLSVAYIPWLAPRAGLLAATLALYAIVQWRRSRAPTRALAWLFVPLATSIALLAYYNWFLYGTPLPVGDLVVGLKVGVKTFHWPWHGLHELSRFLDGAFGLFFDRSFGLLPYAPFYVLAVPGLVALVAWGRSSDRRLAAWMAALAIPYLFFIAAFENWTGIWSAPARYLVTFVPLLAAPLAASLAAGGRVYRALYAVLAAPAVLLMVVMLDDARLLFPINEPAEAATFRWLATNPAAPFHLDLRGFVPSFVFPDESTNAARSGAVLATAFALATLGLLVLAWESGRLRNRTSRTTIAALGSVGLAGAIAAGSWAALNRELLQNHVEMALKRDVPLPGRPLGKPAATYQNGRVYVLRRTGSSIALVAVDPADGRATTVRTGLRLVRPAAIAAAPGGLLYVIDNRKQGYDVYALDGNGTVVNRTTLRPGTGVATDIASTPNRLYVTNPQELLLYRPRGGAALRISQGVNGGFNNGWSVAVDGRGRAYVAELSAYRLQEFTPDGRFLRQHPLHECQPVDLAYRAGLLAVSCEDRVVFLDTRSGTIRRARVSGPDRHRSTGALTFTSGNTLAVLQPERLRLFQVQPS